MTAHVSRRSFFGATAGAMALVASAAASTSPAFASTRAVANGRLIPDRRVGTILYTQRDAISRQGIHGNPAPTMGHLGGPTFPDDVNDLGPLVPLPGGFLEVFEYLASVGYSQIEFAGLGQNAANRGGTAPNLGSVNNPANLYANRAAYLTYIRGLRGFLDATGLRAIGNHGYIPTSWDGPGSPSVGGSPAGTMNPFERDRFQLELEAAAILGMEFTGTGNDPTSANNRNVEAWDLAAEKWLALNAMGRRLRVSVYPHNHSPAYNFIADGPMVEVTVDRITGAPLAAPVMVRGESPTRLMEHYLKRTDRTCPIELDIFWGHVANHQHRWYFDHDGQRRENIFDPTAFAAREGMRIPLFHAKDGDHTGAEPGVGNGYNIVPFGDASSDIDFERFFRSYRPKGQMNPNYEQDNAPGGATDPGRSLRNSRFSAGHMLNLRG
ncbi:hypothetical protein [Jannaschia sp. R86511]|uniref:hypothetical protein n=1 Tax=Jannaschia sp. R86511 TaxID=3093853 RepID=UPI0036D2C521